MKSNKVEKVQSTTQPPRLEKPVRITEQVWPEGTVPVVSVFNWAYNHVEFIRESIESILMQETTFPVEIIIHDDASTDGTTEIIREYEAKYPQLFRNIIQIENQWSQGESLMVPLTKSVRGEFVAFSHGDDYWGDPLKLLRQADFLSADSKYVATTHPRLIIDHNGDNRGDIEFSIPYRVDSSEDDLRMCKTLLPTLTLMVRNVVGSLPREADNVLNGDMFLWSYLGQFGKCKFLRDIKPAVYRSTGSGTWSSLRSGETHVEKANTYYWLYKYHKRMRNSQCAEYFIKCMADEAVCVKSTEELMSVVGDRKRLSRNERRAHLLLRLRRFPGRLVRKVARIVRMVD